MCVIFVIYFLLYYFRNNTTSPFVTIWHAFIIYIHSCYYICQGVFLHDPRCSRNRGNFEYLFEKMSKIALSYQFQKTLVILRKNSFYSIYKGRMKIKMVHKAWYSIMYYNIWGEYSNVYFLVIFFIYQVVALFSLANDSYILLFKNDSYKSTKHFIGKTFFYFSTINHFNSRYFTLLDNASNQVVGCTIQKIYNNKCPSFEWLFAIVMNNE